MLLFVATAPPLRAAPVIQQDGAPQPISDDAEPAPVDPNQPPPDEEKPTDEEFEVVDQSLFPIDEPEPTEPKPVTFPAPEGPLPDAVDPVQFPEEPIKE
ncbi:MAG: hypothetical protein AAF633_21340 [Chloroflexota bacterium]